MVLEYCVLSLEMERFLNCDCSTWIDKWFVAVLGRTCHADALKITVQPLTYGNQQTAGNRKVNGIRIQKR